jgi:hypothetical protein
MTKRILSEMTEMIVQQMTETITHQMAETISLKMTEQISPHLPISKGIRTRCDSLLEFLRPRLVTVSSVKSEYISARIS